MRPWVKLLAIPGVLYLLAIILTALTGQWEMAWLWHRHVFMPAAAAAALVGAVFWLAYRWR